MNPEKLLQEEEQEVNVQDSIEFTQEQASFELEKGYEYATEILNDEDKLERLLQRLEQKLASIPKLGKHLSHIPVFASLLRSYIKREYTDIPIGTIVAIISAVVYFVSPVDIIPDFVPGAGYIDDAGVIVACLALVDSDVKEYMRWREVNGKKIDL